MQAHPAKGREGAMRPRIQRLGLRIPREDHCARIRGLVLVTRGGKQASLLGLATPGVPSKHQRNAIQHAAAASLEERHSVPHLPSGRRRPARHAAKGSAIEPRRNHASASIQPRGHPSAPCASSKDP